MKKTALIILLLGSAAPAAWCANSAGTSAVPFLKLAADARSVGMGEAAAGAAGGGMALFQNPAGLAGNKAPALAFSHALLMEDISYEVLGAALPLGSAGVLGVGAQYLNYGNVDSLYNDGTAAGSLAPKDSAYALGWGMHLDPDIMVGAGLKYVNSKISGSAATTALDLGLLINGEDLSVGFTAQNMGKGLKFNDESSPLPVNVKLGVAMPYGDNWQWVADVNFPKDAPAWLAAGGEYLLAVKGDWSFFGRAGYNTGALDTKGINGLAAGFGVGRRNLAFDYAFKTMGMLGSTHHLGLNYKWGAVAEPEAKPLAKSVVAVVPVVKQAGIPAARPAAELAVKPAADAAVKPAVKPAGVPAARPAAKPAANH
ncbi:MAG TPA: PorV/PorQ family protein [Elusimicrobiales bacterium]|nr:PorV/PorQ family protein [Elusimicrobiales bacterium]